jgi:hypothetical protein
MKNMTFYFNLMTIAGKNVYTVGTILVLFMAMDFLVNASMGRKENGSNGKVPWNSASWRKRT